MSKFQLYIMPKRRPQFQKTAKRLNISKLKTSKVAEEFSNNLDGRLPNISQDDQLCIDEQWPALRDAVYSTTSEHLGPATRKNQDWFNKNDQAIQTLLSEKHQLFRAHQNDPTSQVKKDTFVTARGKVQKKLRE